MRDFTTDMPAGPQLTPECRALLTSLVGAGALVQAEADRAETAALRLAVPLADILLRDLDLDATDVARHQAAVAGAVLIDPRLSPPDPALIDRFGVAACLRSGLLPWQQGDTGTLILTCRPETFAAHIAQLNALFGPVTMAVTTEAALTAAVTAQQSASLVAQAENCVPLAQSCRQWNHARARLVAACALAGLAGAALLAPAALLVGLMVWAIAVLAVTTALKTLATLQGLRATAGRPPSVADHDLPVITMLIPLYQETAIASHLLVRLAALRYPRALLDICLVLEEDDTTTRATLARTALPGWIRAITVPPGQVRTKPRALNYALAFARGDIIGVWDAEDAPAADQLHVVAQQFAHLPAKVACLQGVLDYYNARRNWLTRCFTIEYAAWFRVVLPGLAAMGLVVPLGGTTLFFRRAALEDLGGWDAHNVTEDADLGLRLARHGYRTALIPTVTLEEANGRVWPWIKQRSRWLKGYAITYGVHMRQPRALLRDLGWWQFAGVQVLFLGTLSLFVLLPLFWTLWLVPLGFGHPLQLWLAPWAFAAITYGFIAAELLALLVNLAGLHKAGKLRLAGWALTLPVYFPLGALAAYRGLTELATRPFYWDKTAHNVQSIPPPRPLPHPASTA